MAPQTPAPASRCRLAALTMASTSRVVMSPSTTPIRSGALMGIAGTLRWIEAHQPYQQQQPRNRQGGGDGEEGGPAHLLGEPAAPRREQGPADGHEGGEQGVLRGGKGEVAEGGKIGDEGRRTQPPD